MLWAEYAENSLRKLSTGLTPCQCVLGYPPWSGESTDLPAVNDHFKGVRQLGSHKPVPGTDYHSLESHYLYYFSRTHTFKFSLQHTHLIAKSCFAPTDITERSFNVLPCLCLTSDCFICFDSCCLPFVITLFAWITLVIVCCRPRLQYVLVF